MISIAAEERGQYVRDKSGLHKTRSNTFADQCARPRNFWIYVEGGQSDWRAQEQEACTGGIPRAGDRIAVCRWTPSSQGGIPV